MQPSLRLLDSVAFDNGCNQTQHFEDKSTRVNSQLNTRQLREVCVLGTTERNMLRDAVTDNGLSTRAIEFSRLPEPSDNAPNIKADHIHKAINYRIIDSDPLEGKRLRFGLEDLCKPMKIAAWLDETYFGNQRIWVDQV